MTPDPQEGYRHPLRTHENRGDRDSSELARLGQAAIQEAEMKPYARTLPKQVSSVNREAWHASREPRSFIEGIWRDQEVGHPSVPLAPQPGAIQLDPLAIPAPGPIPGSRGGAA